jgi:hypothetical protein
MRSEQRRRESSEQLFQFFSIDLTMLLDDEKPSIDFSNESSMTDVLTRSSRDVFITMSSFLQDVDVDSFID